MIFGSPERVAFAKYAWVYLIREFRRLWSAYRKRTGSSERSRRSYYAGLELGFTDRLARERATRTVRLGEENALRLRREEEKVAKAFDEKFPDTRTVSRPNLAINSADAFYTGLRQGSEIELRKPLAAPAAQLLIGQE